MSPAIARSNTICAIVIDGWLGRQAENWVVRNGSPSHITTFPHHPFFCATTTTIANYANRLFWAISRFINDGNQGIDSDEETTSILRCDHWKPLL
jgi:hypothetical protein